MSEEIRFKYLEELERSEALDGAVDISWERRNGQRNEDGGNDSEKNKKNSSKLRRKSDSSRKDRYNKADTEFRKQSSDKAAGQNVKNRKAKNQQPESDVRSVDVPESWDGSGFVGSRWKDAPLPDNDRFETETKSSVRRKRLRTTDSERKRGEKRSGKRRRKGSGREERVTDWDAYIEETARLEAEDSLREERETRRQNRAIAAEKRELKEKARRSLFLRIGIGVAALVLIVLAAGLVIRTVRSNGSGQAGNYSSGTDGAGNSQTESNMEVISGEETGSGTDVTVAPASSVVSIDSADQLTTLFEDWQYTPSPTDVAPEGDIVPLTDTFYSHDMMKRDLYLLRERYPEDMTILCFGYSADGRELLDVVIGNASAQKDVIIQYSIHAREYVNSLLAMKQIEELLKGMNNGTQYNGASYTDILQGVRLHLIPMLNPDGVMISLYGFDAIGNEALRNGLYECWQSDILLGKGDPDLMAYFQRWKANARCVDLNRNFDSGWDTTVGTTQPSCSRYKGESAESEAETKALVALKNAINCVGQIAYHSEGEIVYWDYGSKGDLHVTDEQLADLVSGLTGYSKESTVSSNQEAAGCSDYFILECGIPSITIETGVGDCPIHIDQWETIWNQNSQVVPAIAQFFAQM